MNRSYILNNKYPLPGVLVWFLASSGLSLAVFTVMGVAIWMIWGESDQNLLDAFPGFVTVLFGIWGAYTVIGGISLWIAAWTYWIVVDRSTFGARAGWFLALLLGMHYGALIYAFYIWKTGRIKAATSHDVFSSAK